MIIQSLHKKNWIIVKGKRYKQILLLTSAFYFISFTLFSQDSIPLAVSASEKNNIEFQEHFFKALSDKATFNYKNAIERLEKCNQLIPNNATVLFELAKNYSKLGRNNEALNYIDAALDNKPNNVWMLTLKVSVLEKLANFDDAITTQQKIAETNPKEKQYLVYLHLKNNDVAAAKTVLTELENAKLLNSRLRAIKSNLYKKKKPKTPPNNTVVKGDEKTLFEQEKSFISLKALLEKLDNENDADLLKYSDEGLTLFPAQPFVYLMNGKALNKNKEYKKALQSLQNGIDFVIDNNKLEAAFYLQMSVAYDGLNDAEKARSFKNKASKMLK